jgi:CMP/dCMP kinase
VDFIPVITIDGPSGSGKSTIAQWLAKKLSWNILDSGALYRVLALVLEREAINLDDEEFLKSLVDSLDVRFAIEDINKVTTVFLNNKDINYIVRDEKVGNMASKIATFVSVRNALLHWQRSFRQSPGLVTDGRDMGTAIFPDANVKIFLSASCEERAKRRYNQLLDNGINVKLAALIDDIAERDLRDQNRDISPLKKAEDAVVIDTTDKTIETVRDSIWQVVQQRLSLEKFGPTD